MKYCPRCGNPLGQCLGDGSFQMKHKGRTIRIRPPASIEIGCEDCGYHSEMVLDNVQVAALA